MSRLQFTGHRDYYIEPGKDKEVTRITPGYLEVRYLDRAASYSLDLYFKGMANEYCLFKSFSCSFAEAIFVDSDDSYRLPFTLFHFENTERISNGVEYLAILKHLSANGVLKEEEFYFTLADDVEYMVLAGNLNVTSNDHLGCLEIEAEIGETTSDGLTVFRLYRKSWDSEYLLVKEQEVYFDYSMGMFWTWQDFTAEAGTWYSYKLDIITSYSDNPVSIYANNKVISAFDDIYLIGDTEVLNVKFNPSVSGLKLNYKDTIVETLGSAYPFVRRNGNTRYKTFTLGGLISYEADEKNLFYSPADAFGSDLEDYQNFIQQEGIDFIYERKFRDKVIQFLYANKIRYLKSSTEGNMLVRLSNISLTPEARLGRVIYSFSCTVTEVAEFSIENLTKYGIFQGKSV